MAPAWTCHACNKRACTSHVPGGKSQVQVRVMQMLGMQSHGTHAVMLELITCHVNVLLAHIGLKSCCIYAAMWMCIVDIYCSLLLRTV